MRHAQPGPGPDHISPQPNLHVSDDINQNSIVLKMTYGSVSFPFMGDADSIIESHLANSGANLQADILKVGNHGSATSSSSAFLSKAQPQTSVIEVGAWNSYGPPTSATHMSPGPGGIGCVSHRPEWRCNGDNWFSLHFQNNGIQTPSIKSGTVAIQGLNSRDTLMSPDYRILAIRQV